MNPRWHLHKVLLGCVLVPAAFVGGMALLIPPLVREVSGRLDDFTSETGRWQELYDRWHAPPPGTPPDRLFPRRVAGFTRVESDTHSAFDGLTDELPARHASYRSDRLSIDLYHYRAIRLEKEALFRRVAESIEPIGTNVSAGSSSRISVGGPESDWYYFSLSPPDSHTVFWWKEGAILQAFVQSDATLADLRRFLGSYLDHTYRPPGGLRAGVAGGNRNGR